MSNPEIKLLPCLPDQFGLALKDESLSAAGLVENQDYLFKLKLADQSTHEAFVVLQGLEPIVKGEKLFVAEFDFKGADLGYRGLIMSNNMFRPIPPVKPVNQVKLLGGFFCSV